MCKNARVTSLSPHFIAAGDGEPGPGRPPESRPILDAFGLASARMFPMSHPDLTFRLVHWAVSALSLLITAYIVPGFKVKSFFSALVTALVIGLANIFIWPILFWLTFPLTVLTLGLFTFLLDAVVLKICARILRDFTLESWWSAIFGAVILSLVSTGLHYLLV